MPNTYFKQTQGYRPSAGPGRAKGSTNVLSRSIREGLLAVWHRCGSVEGMVQWVERDDSNRTAFYGFLTKLLPAELAEAGYGSGITVIVQRSISKDTEVMSTGHDVLPATGGEIPDSRGQGMGPDLGTLTHESQLTHEESGVPTQSGAGGTGGYFGRARTGKGSPTGGHAGGGGA